MTEQTHNPTLQEKVAKLRSHPYAKYVVLGAAAGLGAFLGVRASLKQITNDVHHMAGHLNAMDHNLYDTAGHVIDEIHYQQNYRENNRRAIGEAEERGVSFAFYPGLGAKFESAAHNPEKV